MAEAFENFLSETPTVINSVPFIFFIWWRKFEQTYNAVLSYNNQNYSDHYIDIMLGTEEYLIHITVICMRQVKGAATDEFADLELTDKGKINAA
ncbi:hypothetical protein NXV16_20645 [Bacteroides fragilis]|nr:hypothetical protein [Bacteroides fragilis]